MYTPLPPVPNFLIPPNINIEAINTPIPENPMPESRPRLKNKRRIGNRRRKRSFNSFYVKSVKKSKKSVRKSKKSVKKSMNSVHKGKVKI